MIFETAPSPSPTLQMKVPSWGALSLLAKGWPFAGSPDLRPGVPDGPGVLRLPPLAVGMSTGLPLGRGEGSMEIEARQSCLGNPLSYLRRLLLSRSDSAKQSNSLFWGRKETPFLSHMV